MSEDKQQGFNPIIALMIVILISVSLVVISTIIFFNSDSFATVKQIQKGVKAANSTDLSKYDTTSPVKSQDIEEFNNKIKNQLSPIGSEDELSKPAIDYQSVGL
jgi:flagellar basal body-associated protein FliL